MALSGAGVSLPGLLDTELNVIVVRLLFSACLSRSKSVVLVEVLDKDAISLAHFPPEFARIHMFVSCRHSTRAASSLHPSKPVQDKGGKQVPNSASFIYGQEAAPELLYIIERAQRA